MEEALRTVMEREPRIAYALLFGSAARNEETPFSDVDVAIGLKQGEQLDVSAIGSLVTELERATRRTIDLLLLDGAPPSLAYRVFRDGKVIFEADRRARVERQTRAVLEYLDFKPVEELFARAVLKAAARG